MIINVKFDYQIYQELLEYLLKDSNEQHAFLFCTSSVNKDSKIIFPKKIVVINQKHINNSPYSINIDKELLHRVFLEFINSDFTDMIDCHSHPFSKSYVNFSQIDDNNDYKIMSYFYNEIVKHKKNADYFSMVFGQTDIAARKFIQSFISLSNNFLPLDYIVVMGEPIRYILPTNNSSPQKKLNSEIFNRQILAFGEEGQKQLAFLNVVLIGAGGTGSILAEGLLRLGVTQLTIIDDDKLEESNLNRWQGGGKNDIGKYKVNILKKRLRNLFSNVKIVPIKKNIVEESTIDLIKNCDVLIGAVDNHKTRYYLNKIAIQYLIPYFDCSSAIILDDVSKKIKKIAVRNTIVIPSYTSCLDCVKGRYYDKNTFFHELLSEESKRELIAYGYIMNNNEVKSPAVYPINMLSVSLLLLEFINLFTGYKPLSWNTYMNYLDLSENHIYARTTDSFYEQPSKDCLHCNDLLGQADKERIIKKRKIRN